MDTAAVASHADAPPLVSVIVPVFNQHEQLQRCLAALGRQTFPADRFEVIVVENSSAIPPRLEPHLRVRCLTEARPGSYAARNHGIEAARGEVIAFTDADCEPRHDWIERGVQAVRRLRGDGMVGGRIEVRVHDPGRVTIAELIDVIMAFPQEAYLRNGFAATANLFTTRATFTRVGLFDDAFLSGGDVEWGDRVRTMGLQQTYEDAVVVSHDARITLRALWRKSRRVAGGVQRMAQRRGAGVSGIVRHVNHQLLRVRKIRTHLNDRRLDTLGRKLTFAAVVWSVDLLHTIERCRVQLGGTPSRV